MSQRVHHPLHAPGSIVVAPTSVATLVALDSMLVTLIPDNLEYTWGAVTKDLVKDLNVTARQQAWMKELQAIREGIEKKARERLKIG